MAWHRRHIDSRGYSLCGVTHTTASHAIMDAIGALHIAPVQSWDAIICTSTVVRKTIDYVLSNWGRYLEERLKGHCMAPVQLPVIPLGVDCDRFQPSPSTSKVRKELRDKYGINYDDIAFLFLGRLSFHAKAHPLPMYLALEEVARKSKDRIHLIQAGWFANEEIETAFRSGAQQWCPSVNVIVVDGRNRNVRNNIWYAADIFTALSDNIQETFGLAPVEAMAAGLPVVVSDWDGYRDTMRNGVEGFAVPTVMPAPGVGADLALRYAMGIDSYDVYIGHASQFTAVDVGACADAYSKLVSDRELRRSMGEAGRKRAREVFDWSIIISAYQNLWRELEERRRVDGELVPSHAQQVRHPLRDDPFSVFRSYPSTTMDGKAMVSVRTGRGIPGVKELRAHPLTSLSNHLLASEKDCEDLLTHLRAHGECTVSELLSLFSQDERQVVVHRTLAWLAKVGLVSIKGVARSTNG